MGIVPLILRSKTAWPLVEHVHQSFCSHLGNGWRCWGRKRRWKPAKLQLGAANSVGGCWKNTWWMVVLTMFQHMEMRDLTSSNNIQPNWWMTCLTTQKWWVEQLVNRGLVPNLFAKGKFSQQKWVLMDRLLDTNGRIYSKTRVTRALTSKHVT